MVTHCGAAILAQVAFILKKVTMMEEFVQLIAKILLMEIVLKNQLSRKIAPAQIFSSFHCFCEAKR